MTDLFAQTPQAPLAEALRPQTLDDVIANGKNINFGIGDPNSTSGFLVPSYYIFAQRNIEARNTFKTVRNASHGANIQATLAKQVDVATNNSENIEKLKAHQPEKVKEVKIIWTSPLIPLDPLVMSKNLPEATKAKIKALRKSMGCTKAEAREMLAAIS